MVLRFGNTVFISPPDGAFIRPVNLLNDTETLRPNAAGSETSITSQSPASGSHWDKVDDTGSGDNSATYVSENGVAYKRDLYNLPASSGSGTINFVKVYVKCASVGLAGTCYAKTSMRSDSTTTDGAENTLTTSWTLYSTQYNTNPADSAAWAWADIDALQIGVILKGAIKNNGACTQVYVEVDYTPSAPQYLEPVPVASISAIQAPSISGSGAATLTLVPVAAASAIQAPSVSGSGSAPVAPDPVVAVSSIQSPAIAGSGAASIAPDPVAAASSIQSPSLSGSGSAPILLVPVAAVSAIQAPGISGSGTATILLIPVEAISEIQAPSLSGSGSAPLAPSPVAAMSSIQAPSIAGTGVAYILLVPVEAVASIQAPAISGSGTAVIILVPVEAITSIQAPAISGSGAAFIEVGPLAVVASIMAPVLSRSSMAVFLLDAQMGIRHYLGVISGAHYRVSGRRGITRYR